jgi:hypothetical protein
VDLDATAFNSDNPAYCLAGETDQKKINLRMEVQRLYWAIYINRG